MKNKIAIASAFLAASSFSTAEIVINDFLSFEGFVDMSYVHTDTETGNVDANQNSFQIDQVEISWLFDFDPVTAQIDLQYEDAPTDVSSDGTAVEQAFVTYHFNDGGAITAGRYASMLGFEAFEPTGLYQYSFGYDFETRFPTLLPGYAQGVKYTHETDTTFFGVSVQDEAFELSHNQFGGNNGESSWALEVAGSLFMENGVSFFLGGAYEDGDASGDTYAIDAYVTFETGAWLFAAEVVYTDTENNVILPGYIDQEEESLAFLLMANFAYSDQASVTGRFSYIDAEEDASGGGEEELFKYTVAHGYAFTDNLFLVTELSYVDGEIGLNGATDFEALEAAVELIFSF